MRTVGIRTTNGCATLVMMVCAGCLLAGCDRATATIDLEPPHVTDKGDPEAEFEKLSPQESTAGTPQVSFVRGEQYVNTSGVKLVWINPTDAPWYIAPGSERFVVKKKLLALRAPRRAPVIATRVDCENGSQARVISPNTEPRGEKGPVHMPKPVELDDRSLIWPGIITTLGSQATLVPLDENLVLPPRSKGYLLCAFAAYGYSSAEFSLQLTDGTRKSDFSESLSCNMRRYSFGGRGVWLYVRDEQLGRAKAPASP